MRAASRPRRSIACNARGARSRACGTGGERTTSSPLHRNAQRLLRPLTVVNPYADRLSFLSDKTRTRRDHEKYLTLIDTIALLHQYQRAVKKVHDARRRSIRHQ